MITIALPPEIEKRLKGEASRRGLGAEEYAKRLIVAQLPPDEATESVSALFAQWEAEDATDDPAEISRRNCEVDEFKEAMNRNRQDMEGSGSRKPFP
jgi:hypothetical protein